MSAAQPAADVALVPKREPAMTGTRRYALALAAELARAGVRVVEGETVGPPLVAALRRVSPALAASADAFFNSYPLGVRAPPARLVHLTMESLATALLVGRPRRPVVVTVHDVISHLTRNDPHLRSYAHPVHEAFDRLSLLGLRRADLLLADSRWTAEMLSRHVGVAPTRVRVVPLGVDLDRFCGDGGPDPLLERALHDGHGDAPWLVYVGSLAPRKNLGALLRALPAIRVRVPETRLAALVFGAVPAKEAVQALARELGIEGAVVWLEGLPDATVAALYRRATVAVVPSLYEGFGLPALEAMACGAPLVSSDRASLPEVVGDAGVTCAPESEAIARAVGDLLLDRNRRMALATAGRARARQFTWERTAAETRSAYAALEAAPGRV